MKIRNSQKKNLEIKKTNLFLEHNWLVEHNPEVD